MSTSQNIPRGDEWVRLTTDSTKWIARSTLSKLASLLAGQKSGPSAMDQAITAPVAKLAGLADVGGTALIDPEQGPAVAVARISQVSFVGYVLESESGELAEVPVKYDPSTDQITTVPGKPGSGVRDPEV